MKFALISDTHCQLSKVKVEPADILIHSGDFTFRGNDPEIADFIRDLEKLAGNFDKIILVAGNHDWMCQVQKTKFRDYISAIPNVEWLHDRSVEIGGMNFFGTSWQPYFMDWAYNIYRGKLLREKYSVIPNETDILITHSPPSGILDSTITGKLAGSVELREKVEEVKPILHCFGHIHHSRGSLKKFGSTFVNSSICTEKYRPTNKPIYVEVKNKSVTKISD